jgi:hypothetical protein
LSNGNVAPVPEVLQRLRFGIDLQLDATLFCQMDRSRKLHRLLA